MADSKLNLYQKIAAIMDEVGAVEKTGRNSQQNYDFIEQAMVVASIRPLLVKHGVVIMPEMVENTLNRTEAEKTDKYGTKVTVTIHSKIKSRYHVINADNPEERFISEWGGEAIDYSDKATNKALTASNKTYLMKLFNISDKDDPDAESPEPAHTPAPKVSEPEKYELSGAKSLKIKSLLSALDVFDDKRDAILGQVTSDAKADELVKKLEEKLAAKKEPKVEPIE